MGLLSGADGEELDDSGRFFHIGRISDHLMNLLKGNLNLEETAGISDQVLLLGCLFGAATNIDLDLKSTITRILSITVKIACEHLSPALAKVETLQNDVSELSDEVQGLSDALDEKDTKLKENEEKFRKENAALHQMSAKRTNDLDARLKAQSAEYAQVKKVQNELAVELKGMRERTKKAEEHEEHLKQILKHSRQSNTELKRRNEALLREIEELRQRDQSPSEDTNPPFIYPPPTEVEMVHLADPTDSDFSSEMVWKNKRKPAATLRLPPDAKRAKLPRTQTKIGPLVIENGKLSKAAQLGSRRAGIN